MVYFGLIHNLRNLSAKLVTFIPIFDSGFTQYNGLEHHNNLLS